MLLTVSVGKGFGGKEGDVRLKAFVPVFEGVTPHSGNRKRKEFDHHNISRGRQAHPSHPSSLSGSGGNKCSCGCLHQGNVQLQQRQVRKTIISPILALSLDIILES